MYLKRTIYDWLLEWKNDTWAACLKDCFMINWKQ